MNTAFQIAMRGASLRSTPPAPTEPPALSITHTTWWADDIVANDNDLITTWSNRVNTAGWGNFTRHTGDTQRPTYKATGLAGQPCLAFNDPSNSSDMMQSADPGADKAQPGGYFMVTKNVLATGTVVGETDTGKRRLVQYDSGAGGKFRINGGASAITHPWDNTTVHFHWFHYNGASSHHEMDGSRLTVSAGTQAARIIRLGDNISGPNSSPSSFRIGLMYAYHGTPSAQDVADVEEFVTSHYGVTIA